MTKAERLRRLAALEEKLKIKPKLRVYVCSSYSDGRVEWKDGREPPPDLETLGGDVLVARIRYIAPPPVPDAETIP